MYADHGFQLIKLLGLKINAKIPPEVVTIIGAVPKRTYLHLVPRPKKIRSAKVYATASAQQK